MDLKIIALSTIASALLTAASPMVSTSMSTDNGGTKLAIDAYSDGGGVLLINQASDSKVDNSAMNKLVFKYGDAAKNSNTTLKNQVNVLSPTATALEKADATTKLEVAKVVINPPVNGTQCDDGISTTSGDVWQNGMCAGPLVDGMTCNDDVTMTYGDKYTAGVCAGTYATSCKVIKTAMPTATDGTYTIDPDGLLGAAPYSVVCDMTTEGGGWTYLSTEMKTNGVGTNTGQNGLVASSVYPSLTNGSAVHFGAGITYKTPEYTELYYKQTAGAISYSCAGVGWNGYVSGGGSNVSLNPLDYHYPGWAASNTTFSTHISSNNIFVKLTAPSPATMVQVGIGGYSGCTRSTHSTVIKVR